jgi:hypothetical protein
MNLNMTRDEAIAVNTATVMWMAGRFLDHVNETASPFFTQETLAENVLPKLQLSRQLDPGEVRAALKSVRDESNRNSSAVNL